MPEIDVEAAAADPKRMRTMEGSVEERSINDLIAAKNYVATETAVTGGVPWGLRLARLKPNGTV